MKTPTPGPGEGGKVVVKVGIFQQINRRPNYTKYYA